MPYLTQFRILLHVIGRRTPHLPVAQFRQAASRNPTHRQLTCKRPGSSMCIFGSIFLLPAESKNMEPQMHTDAHG
jgi:hypothetical protein